MQGLASGDPAGCSCLTQADTGCDYEVPSADGELLVAPSPATWATTLRQNRDLLARSAALPGPLGQRHEAFRVLVRRQLLALAGEYTRQVMGDAEVAARVQERAGSGREEPGGVPIIATGHQPLFYHPGIWAKNVVLQLAADHLAGEAGIPPVTVNLVVDTDSAADLRFPVPLRASSPGGGPGRPEWRLEMVDPPFVQPRPFVLQAPPSATELEGWLEKIDAAIAPGDLDELREGWQQSRRLVATTARSGGGLASLGDWLACLRRRWESRAGAGRPRYLELPVSWLARTPAFMAYVFDIVARAEEFHSVYNQELRAYRERRKIRSRANPFPDLGTAGGALELPFWLVLLERRPSGVEQRQSLACSRGGRGELVLSSFEDGRAGEPFLRLPPPPAPEAPASSWESWGMMSLERWQASGARVWPKALTLTLFTRLFFSDLFIHGVGGGRYDRVTEAVARSFYGQALPEGAVVSFTSYLPLPIRLGVSGEMGQIRAFRRDLEQNPQRYLERLTDEGARAEATRLAARKEKLIARLATASREEKRELARELAQTTQELARFFRPLLAELDRRLEELAVQAKEEEVARFREYPFLLYDPGLLWDRIASRWGSLLGGKTAATGERPAGHGQPARGNNQAPSR
ncbi:MAG TPA: hypothetical protein GXX55_06430 [Firmicutes bacterium]|nr:hypothetical protein [Bacillota bacterium]